MSKIMNRLLKTEAGDDISGVLHSQWAVAKATLVQIK